MIGVVDVGGGTRGSFGAGVFDACLDQNIHFDVCAGVSAGSANCSSYLAGQLGRNYRFYVWYAFRKKYMSLSNMIRLKNYVDLDYVYSTLSNGDGEDPLDYEAIVKNPAEMIMVATDAQTGKPTYFTKADMKQDCYDTLKASCSVPVVEQPYPFKGGLYFDGGISDPIPFQKVFDMGCDFVVVILTRPKDYFRESKSDRVFADLMEKHYPLAAEAMRKRSEVYNAELHEALRLEKEGKVLIVAPNSIGHMKTLTKDKNAIRELYAHGWFKAQKLIEKYKDLQ